MAKIKLQDINNWIDSCIMVITETWLYENILDLAEEFWVQSCIYCDCIPTHGSNTKCSAD